MEPCDVCAKRKRERLKDMCDKLAEKLKRNKIKGGWDKHGMPYIDLTDRETAKIIMKKIEKGFDDIKITTENNNNENVRQR